jgi:hypothetical protein
VAQTIWILQAEHKTVPGVHTQAFKSLSGADAARDKLEVKFKRELGRVEIIKVELQE